MTTDRLAGIDLVVIEYHPDLWEQLVLPILNKIDTHKSSQIDWMFVGPSKYRYPLLVDLDSEKNIEYLDWPLTPGRFRKMCLHLRGGSVRHVSHFEDSVLKTELLPLRVLVVEDNGVNQLVIKRMLGRLVEYCVVVSSGSEALKMMQRQIFDLVLIDCDTPE